MKLGDYVLDPNRTEIMGILNVTPDSFSDGGLYTDVDKAVSHAKEMIAQGATIIDIGAESSRPGSDPVSEEEELKRILPVLKRLASEVDVVLSIDTQKPGVARECLKLGAQVINDITGLADEKMMQVISEYNASVVIMHMQGEPRSMQQSPTYTDVVEDIISFFEERISAARNAGIDGVIVDPGIGFGKTVEHNLQILKKLEEFSSLGVPLLIGTSRKSFIGKISDIDVDERLEGTIASNVVAIMNGARIIRVHDVKECKRAVQIVDAIRSS